jgi:hypothetical protein
MDVKKKYTLCVFITHSCGANICWFCWDDNFVSSKMLFIKKIHVSVHVIQTFLEAAPLMWLWRLVSEFDIIIWWGHFTDHFMILWSRSSTRLFPSQCYWLKTIHFDVLAYGCIASWDLLLMYLLCWHASVAESHGDPCVSSVSTARRGEPLPGSEWTLFTLVSACAPDQLSVTQNLLFMSWWPAAACRWAYVWWGRYMCEFSSEVEL